MRSFSIIWRCLHLSARLFSIYKTYMAEDIIKSLVKAKEETTLEYLVCALSVARQAGQIVHEAYHKDKDVLSKGIATDLVTETDERVEKFIFDGLRKEFRTHRFIGEESVAAGSSSELTEDPTWIVDPIDGTCNFVHRFPYVAVSIGLAVKKKILLGIVYAPILDDMYIGVRGHGSYVNSKRLSVNSGIKSLSQALVASEWGASRDPSIMEQRSRNFLWAMLGPGVHGMRCTGSAALNMCLVARGSCDVYFEFGPHCWDVAAASVILEEAGGALADTQGNEFDLMCCRFLVAANRSLIDQMVPHLKEIPVKRDDE